MIISTTGDRWLTANPAEWETNKSIYKKLWKQISERFADYGEKLLFESCNEIPYEEGLWNIPPQEAYKVMNQMQANKDKFLHAIRKFMQMQTLSAPLLRELIDRIDVCETKGTGKNRTQRIMIHYKFAGVIEIPDDGDNYTADTRKGVAIQYVTKSA